jgi:membrane protease YdiL (CAAX protease family)
MNENLRSTLKVWPVIAIATIGLNFATQWIAKLFGIDLPDQEQMTTVKNFLPHAFDSVQHFKAVVKLLFQVILMAPALEEVLFRLTGWKLPSLALARGKCAAAVTWTIAAVSSVAFSAAHYVDYMTLSKGGEFKFLPLSSAFIALFFFGLAQCWLYMKTRRLWCPMLNHALFNITNLVLIFVVPD